MREFHRFWGGWGGSLIGRRAARMTMWAGTAILGVALLAGAIRVLPWFVAPNVPFRVALPFARALLAMGLEATLLCAPPIGWALASAMLVERGEARAVFSIGVSPLRLTRQGLVPAVVFALLAGLASLASGTEAAAPGRLARSLVEQAKQSCGAGTKRPTDVPFVGVTWLCFDDGAPRLTGTLPSGGGAFTSAELGISDDLGTLQFSDMRLLLGEAKNVRVHVHEATVRGLSPWGRASNLPPVWRALLTGATGSALALLSAWIVLRNSISHRLASLLIGGTGPASALVVMGRLEQGAHPAATYLWVPVAGLLGIAAMTCAVRFASWLRAARIAR